MSVVLVVDHLPTDFSDEQLMALFRPFGSIQSAHIVRDSSGNSLQFAFVEMDRAEDASRAIAAIDRKEIQRHTIRVRSIKDLPPTG